MKDTEAKKNLLKVLIPNQKARVFVTEVLSQSTQNFGDMLINQERNQENNTIGSFKSPLQEGYPGNLTDVIGHKNEYNQNENAPSFVFITSKTKSLIYSLEMIHDDKDKNKVVGAKVIAIMPYSATNRALFDLGGKRT